MDTDRKRLDHGRLLIADAVRHRNQLIRLDLKELCESAVAVDADHAKRLADVLVALAARRAGSTRNHRIQDDAHALFPVAVHGTSNFLDAPDNFMTRNQRRLGARMPARVDGNVTAANPAVLHANQDFVWARLGIWNV